VKRLALPTLLLLAIGGLTACTDDDAAVVTVNDHVVLTQGDWEAEVEELGTSNDFLDAFNARGSGGDQTVDLEALTSVLENHVFAPLITELIEQEGIEVTDQDRETGTDILTTVLANPPQQSGNAPIALEDVPESYRDLLTGIYADFIAGLRHFGATPEDQNDPNTAAAQQQFNAALAEVQAAAEVEIAPRYGTWDAEAAEVDLPPGPLTPTTTIALAPAG
jgi:hypothetical protein